MYMVALLNRISKLLKLFCDVLFAALLDRSTHKRLPYEARAIGGVF